MREASYQSPDGQTVSNPPTGYNHPATIKTVNSQGIHHNNIVTDQKNINKKNYDKSDNPLDRDIFFMSLAVAECLALILIAPRGSYTAVILASLLLIREFLSATSKGSPFTLKTLDSLIIPLIVVFSLQMVLLLVV